MCLPSAKAAFVARKASPRNGTHSARWIGLLLLATGLVNCVTVLTAGPGTIYQDAERKLVTLTDGQGQLVLRLNYGGRCVLDQVIVRGREVAAESGVASGICLDGQWFTTRDGIAAPSVAISQNMLIVSGIVFGPPGQRSPRDLAI